MTNITETGEIVLNGIDEKGKHRLGTNVGLMIDGKWASVTAVVGGTKYTVGDAVISMMMSSTKRMM
jgi:hypothetical protein